MHTGVMGVLIQIRDVEPEIRNRLKAKAALRGESLNTYLARLLARDAAQPSREEAVARLAARPDGFTGSSTDLVREARDRGSATDVVRPPIPVETDPATRTKASDRRG